MKLLINFCIKYLTKHDYFIRGKLPMPKIGDEVTYIYGGAWQNNTHYISKGIVDNLEEDYPFPFKQYGYFHVQEIRDGKPVGGQIVYSRDIIEVTKKAK